MPKPNAVTERGYMETFTQSEDGTWTGELSDPNGTIVYSRSGYAREDTAHRGLARWLTEQEARDGRERRDGRDGRTTLPPGTAQLVRMLRKRARDNENQSVHLRAQAEVLETEAKRLYAAVDALDPDGDA